MEFKQVLALGDFDSITPSRTYKLKMTVLRMGAISAENCNGSELACQSEHFMKFPRRSTIFWLQLGRGD